MILNLCTRVTPTLVFQSQMRDTLFPITAMLKYRRNAVSLTVDRMKTVPNSAVGHHRILN